MGILARHAPSLYQLSPGRVDLISPDPAAPLKSYFVSGGFVTVNPDSTMQIAAMEAVSLEQLDCEVRKGGCSSIITIVQIPLSSTFKIVPILLSSISFLGYC